MEYPQEFSVQARARVVAKQLKATRKLEQIQTKEPPEGWAENRLDECAFYAYILRVFLAFAHEACELGRQGTWPVDRIRKKANDFLREFTIEAYYEKGCDRFGNRFREMIDNHDGSLLPELERYFHQSEEWHQFEKALSAIAKRPPAPSDLPGHPSKPESSDGAVPTVDEAVNSRSQARKRGPQRDFETAARVAEVVGRVSPDGRWRENLDEVLLALDESAIPTPKTWKPNHGYRNWYAAVAADDVARGRHMAIEAINHHLKNAKERPTATIL